MISVGVDRRGARKTEPRAYAEALTLARALRSSKRRCFFKRMTLKRSKSVRADRFVCTSRFLAQLEFFHFWSISDFSQNFLTVAVREPRGRPARTKSDRTTCEKETDWRVTARADSEAGPSTRACSVECDVSIHLPRVISFSMLMARLSMASKSALPISDRKRTRLWSMTSTMAARRPASGPDWRTTTRPTWTRRQSGEVMLMSPILAMVCRSEGAD